MVTKMATLTRLQDLMLDRFVEQPKFNVGPFIVCNRPPSNYPHNVITLFYDDNDWGRIAFTLKEEKEDNKYTLTPITKMNEIFIDDAENLNARLKKEAKELEAIVLFSRLKFPNDLEIQLNIITKTLTYDTLIFMTKYFAYQDYLLHKQIDDITNDSRKNSR